MKNKIKYFLRKLKFLKALNSPFKPFKLKWYIGKIAIGTPYFYPRKWVNLTEKEIEEKEKKSKEIKDWLKKLPKPTTLVDEENGDTTTIYPPSKTSKTIIKVEKI